MEPKDCRDLAALDYGLPDNCGIHPPNAINLYIYINDAKDACSFKGFQLVLDWFDASGSGINTRNDATCTDKDAAKCAGDAQVPERPSITISQ